MKNSNPWFGFIGFFLLLVGIFASLHTVYNVTLSKYPQSGVLLINTTGFPPNSQQESDCIYNQVYYAEDGITPREPNAGEKKQTEMDQQRCLISVANARENVRMQDISVSLFFLFLGGGLLLSRKFLLK